MCLRKVFLYIHLSSGSTFLLDSSMLYTKFGKLLAIISSNIFMPLSHHSFHDCKKLCIRLLHSSLSFAHFSSIFFLSVLCKGSFLQSHQVCCCCCFFFFPDNFNHFSDHPAKLYSNCAFRSKTTFLFVLIIFVSIISMGYILALGRLPTCLFTYLYFLLILQTCFLLILLPFKIAALKSLINSNLG